MGYTKQVYDRAFGRLDQRKQKARELTLARKEEIYSRIPEIKEIERNMARTAASVARTVISSPDKAGELVEQLGRENLDLQARRRRLLEANGYPADYLEEQHGCPHCKDKGYVKNKMCGCLADLLKKEAGYQLGRVSRSQDCTFANFQLSFYPSEAAGKTGIVPRARMGEVLEACMQYANSFNHQAESLLMLGHTGLGKTHLSLAIGATVTEKGYGVVYTPVQKLMDRLEAEKFSRSDAAREQYQDDLGNVLECDLLILDDLGTEFATSFTTATLYNIINSRLVEQRPTIISTNLELSAIEERYSQRMVSRLVCGYKVLKFYGRDIRYMKKMRGMQQK